MRKKILNIVLLCITSALISSCGESAAERDGRHPLFVRAESLYENGKYNEAAALYLKYLNLNPDSAKSCYRLGSIYQERNDYIKAIYFYRKYLEIAPKSTDSEVISKWIASAQDGLYKQLSEQRREQAGTTDTASQTINKESRNTYEITRPPSISIAQTTDTNQIDNNAVTVKKPAVKTYTIKYGDTLQKISSKFYGSPNYYKIILEANKDVIPSASELHTDVTIVIPPLNKNSKNRVGGE